MRIALVPSGNHLATDGKPEVNFPIADDTQQPRNPPILTPGVRSQSDRVSDDSRAKQLRSQKAGHALFITKRFGGFDADGVAGG
jgi:hypothetical protein